MYMLVLLTTLIVVAMCVTGLELQRVGQRTNVLWEQASEARLLAQSAAEMGIEQTYRDSSWRKKVSGPLGPFSLGHGKATVELSDPVDGDIGNNADDAVLIRGTATVGGATQHVEVTLDAFHPPMGCLQRAVWTGGTLNFATAVVSATQTVGSNGSVAAVGSSITAPVEAVAVVTGGTYNSGTRAGVSVREMPDSSVLDYYTSHGTNISNSGLPLLNLLLGVLGGRKISKFVLSPGSNPWGSTNMEGIYVIDMGGVDIEIRDCRIYGTLVIKNAGPGTILKGSVLGEPSQPGFPILIVQGNLTIATSAAPLDEASLSTNFNPASTPYQGASNATTTDKYPSALNGLVYCTGTLTTSGQVTVKGALIAGAAATVGGAVSITYDPVYESIAPPGFRTTTQMIVRHGSWRRTVD